MGGAGGSGTTGAGVTGGDPGVWSVPGASRSAGNSTAGGLGGAGQVIISWSCPMTVTLSYAGNPFCQTPGTINLYRKHLRWYLFFRKATGLSIDAGTGVITPSTSTPGTYTITYTIAAAGGCNAISTTTSVTINPLPAVSISTAGNVTTFWHWK